MLQLVNSTLQLVYSRQTLKKGFSSLVWSAACAESDILLLCNLWTGRVGQISFSECDLPVKSHVHINACSRWVVGALQEAPRSASWKGLMQSLSQPLTASGPITSSTLPDELRQNSAYPVPVILREQELEQNKNKNKKKDSSISGLNRYGYSLLVHPPATLCPPRVLPTG
jgi:hypothetical protein